MPKTLLALVFALSFATAGSGQTTQSVSTMQLTVDQAVKMALDNNVDLVADRLDPQIGDTRIAAAAGVFKPVFGTSLLSNNQLAPPSSFLTPTATRTDFVTSEVGLSQRLQRFGTSYSVAWDTTRTTSDSILSSYNPLFQSGLGLRLSQPLVRDFKVDSPRTQLVLSRQNREVTDTRLREALVHTVADVKTAYWNLVAARANVEARQSAVDLAQELARINKVKVDVGQSPPLDMVAAQAEVAADQEQLIIAEAAVKITEDKLRTLIYDPTDKANWNVHLETVDSPPVGMAPIDMDAAVTNALANRTDLERARKNVDIAATNETLASNQRLPDVRLNASYQANGLGGTQVLRTGGFPGTIIGGGDVTSFGSVLGQLFGQNYPTWVVGVNVSYPVGHSVDDANYERTRLEQSQAQARVKSAEGQAIQQIRSAAWTMEANAKRIETTRAARDLAEQRLDAERKRFEVGMSTSFLVIQAQRDLAQARTNELASILAYDLALVQFEALQQAGPAQASQPFTSPTTGVEH